jgi:hypothetical protein
VSLSREMAIEVRRLNVVIREDAETITAVSPCPTAAHRPVKVEPRYIVHFRCPHGESVNVFCEPCTADRRVERYACLGKHLVDEQCPGTYAVKVETLMPRTFQKETS